ncbi:hypothetical protein BDR05DRAFT_990726 [Suillus weaverae]|nr:hypothetical protein BDR05DRAFT_990726 [Suillus weaverae]
MLRFPGPTGDPRICAAFRMTPATKSACSVGKWRMPSGAQGHIPEPGQKLETLSTEGHFYVHIWDFNKRAIARSENSYNPDSPDLFIRKPGGVTQSYFDGEIISNHPYTTTVYRTPFMMGGSRGLFLEQDRLILTSVRPGTVDIQVVSPVRMEVESDFTPYKSISVAQDEQRVTMPRATSLV